METPKQTIAEVAKEWKVHPATVRRWITRGIVQIERRGRVIRIVGPTQKPGTGNAEGT